MYYFVALLYWPLKTICINLFPAWWGIQTAPRLWFKVKDTRFRDRSPNYVIVTKWDSVSVHEHALCSARDRFNGEMNPARAVSNGLWKGAFGKGARDRLKYTPNYYVPHSGFVKFPTVITPLPDEIETWNLFCTKNSIWSPYKTNFKSLSYQGVELWPSKIRSRAARDIVVWGDL